MSITEQKRGSRRNLSLITRIELMLSSSVFGLKLSLETLLKEEVVLSVVLNGTSLVDLTLESLHGDV